MIKSSVDFGIIAAPSDRFDTVIELLIVLLLAFAPLALGAVQAWSEEVVLALSGAILICFLLKHVVNRDAQYVWSWAYVPIAIFLLLVVVQIIPLPAGIVEVISPNTAAMKKELLGDLPNSGESLASMTLSFYPNATKHDLRMILALAAVFVVIVNVYRREEQVKRLLGAVAITGGFVAVLALAQDLFGNGKIYWLVDPGAGNAYSGPFVNHSHFGQFMSLSIGAALGLILVKVNEPFVGKRVSPPAIFEYLSSSSAWPIWLLVSMIVLGVASVFISLTRGGMISMLIGAGFTTLILTSRQPVKGQSWIIAILAFGAFVCVLLVGFDAVYDRLASLHELHQAQGGRWQIVKDISLAWARFPVLGTGLGTHEVVYPMFDRSTVAALAAYAENEYAQAAEETGIVGLGVLLCFGIMVWIFYVRDIRGTSLSISSAAYGLGFGLVAIMVHSLSDFGQHLPANAMLSMVSCALMFVLFGFGHKDKLAGGAAVVSRFSKPLRIIALIVMSGVWAWILIDANNARLAEAGWKKALVTEQRMMELDWQAQDSEYVELISNAARAVELQPENVKYRYWLNVYRWKSVSRVTDPNTGEVVIPEQGIEIVRRIVDELNKARLLCPTYGATYCLVGQLERSVLGDPNGADRIRKGFRLSPCDPAVCFVTGQLYAEEQEIDASFEKFSRAIALDGKLFQAVANVYINHVNRPDLAVAIAGEDIGRLSYAAYALMGREEHKGIVEEARTHVVRLLEERCSAPDTPASAFASLATIYTRENDDEAAMEYYRRALALDYGQVEWRFALAKLLARANRIPDAIHEARICLRLHPQFKAAEKFIADMSVLPRMMVDEETRP